jgi:hypothetical protein
MKASAREGAHIGARFLPSRLGPRPGTASQGWCTNVGKDTKTCA